jgi:DNA-binding response OmpR family regulator
LIVDDDDDIREIAAATLELTTGWEIGSASSGAEAVAMAAAMRPDAILLDVMMPDMDGPTAFRLLRANAETSGVPVILLTAKVQTADRARYLRLGVDDVIAKPFDPLTLGERIAESLGWG